MKKPVIVRYLVTTPDLHHNAGCGDRPASQRNADLHHNAGCGDRPASQR